MNKILKKCAILAAVAAAIIMATDSNPAMAADSKDAELFVMRLPRPYVFDETLIGKALGFFEEEGINIEFVTAVEGLSSFQMLNQGLLDAGGGHPSNVAQAKLAGIKVLGVAPGMVDNPKYPHARYIVKEDGPIKSLDDIVGKKVAIRTYMSCYEGYLKIYLEDKGIKGDVEWVVLSTGGQAEQALSQGLIDMTTTHPPFATIAFKAGGHKQIATSWNIFESAAAGLGIHVFEEDFLAAHPNEVRAYTRALYKTRKWINSHMDEAVHLTAKEFNVDPADVNVELDGRWYAETPGIQKEDIELWFDISERLGYWNHGDLKPEDIFTNEFDPTEEIS